MAVDWRWAVVWLLTGAESGGVAVDWRWAVLWLLTGGGVAVDWRWCGPTSIDRRVLRACSGQKAPCAAGAPRDVGPCRDLSSDRVSKCDLKLSLFSCMAYTAVCRFCPSLQLSPLKAVWVN